MRLLKGIPSTRTGSSNKILPGEMVNMRSETEITTLGELKEMIESLDEDTMLTVILQSGAGDSDAGGREL